MKKNGITVDCKHCTYASSDNRGAFDITVPIIDSETGIASPAKLRCCVSSRGHSVELLEWNGFNRLLTQSKGNLQRRVSATLTFFSARKICGNRNICPSEVVQIVEENNTS